MLRRYSAHVPLILAFLFVSVFLVPKSLAAQTVCEASPPASCYYIDPVHGSDSNPGSYAEPFHSFRNLISYYTGSFRPANWVELKGGDYVYLMSGVYSTLLHPGDDSGSSGGGSYIAYFRSVVGDTNNWIHIVAYPEADPILDPAYAGIGIRVRHSSYFEIAGMAIRNSHAQFATNEAGGISLPGAEHVIIHDIEIYDTDGTDNANMSGLHSVGSANIEIYNSIFHDNYDRTNADTGGIATHNSSNMVFFGGGNISIHDNLFYQTPPDSEDKSGSCLKYKHASDDPNAYFRVYNNTFRNCRFYAITTGTANTHIHHNIFVGGRPMTSRDNGGPTHQTNQIFEYNTVYNSMGFALTPTIDWRDASFPNDPQDIIFRNNIVYDNSSSYSNERAAVVIGTYMSDALYNAIAPEVEFSKNCYFNPNTPIQLNIGAANGGSYGVLGDTYSFAQWQALGYDSSSVNADPLFVDAENNDFHLDSHSPCSEMGVYGDAAEVKRPVPPQNLRSE